jgi:hypothetical protein
MYEISIKLDTNKVEISDSSLFARNRQKQTKSSEVQ